MAESKEKVRCILSSFQGKEKDILIARIQNLTGGVYLDTGFYIDDCNLIICKYPCKGEKYLCGAASGKPLLIPKYIHDSFKAKKWLDDVTPYEWCNQKCTNEKISYLYELPKLLKDIIKDKKKKVFGSWKVLLHEKDDDKRRAYQRLLKAGGAKLVTLKPPFTKDILWLVSHIFVSKRESENFKILYRENFENIAYPEFIVEYIINIKNPSPISDYCPFKKMKPKEINSKYFQQPSAPNEPENSTKQKLNSPNIKKTLLRTPKSLTKNSKKKLYINMINQPTIESLFARKKRKALNFDELSSKKRRIENEEQVKLSVLKVNQIKREENLNDNISSDEEFPQFFRAKHKEGGASILKEAQIKTELLADNSNYECILESSELEINGEGICKSPKSEKQNTKTCFIDLVNDSDDKIEKFQPSNKVEETINISDDETLESKDLYVEVSTEVQENSFFDDDLDMNSFEAAEIDFLSPGGSHENKNKEVGNISFDTTPKKPPKETNNEHVTHHTPKQNKLSRNSACLLTPQPMKKTTNSSRLVQSEKRNKTDKNQKKQIDRIKMREMLKFQSSDTEKYSSANENKETFTKLTPRKSKKADNNQPINFNENNEKYCFIKLVDIDTNKLSNKVEELPKQNRKEEETSKIKEPSTLLEASFSPLNVQQEPCRACIIDTKDVFLDSRRIPSLHNSDSKNPAASFNQHQGAHFPIHIEADIEQYISQKNYILAFDTISQYTNSSLPPKILAFLFSKILESKSSQTSSHVLSILNNILLSHCGNEEMSKSYDLALQKPTETENSIIGTISSFENFYQIIDEIFSSSDEDEKTSAKRKLNFINHLVSFMEECFLSKHPITKFNQLKSTLLFSMIWESGTDCSINSSVRKLIYLLLAMTDTANCAVQYQLIHFIKRVISLISSTLSQRDMILQNCCYGNMSYSFVMEFYNATSRQILTNRDTLSQVQLLFDGLQPCWLVWRTLDLFFVENYEFVGEPAHDVFSKKDVSISKIIHYFFFLYPKKSRRKNSFSTPSKRNKSTEVSTSVTGGCKSVRTPTNTARKSVRTPTNTARKSVRTPTNTARKSVRTPTKITACKSVSTPTRKSMRTPSKSMNSPTTNVRQESSETPSPSGRRKSNPLCKKNPKGENLLQVACKKNNLEKAKELLEMGIDPNMQDHAGWTALHEASNYGYVDCVRELLHSPNLDVYITDFIENVTALHDAVVNNHVKVADMLIQRGGARLLNMETFKHETAKDLATSPQMKDLIATNIKKYSTPRPTLIPTAQHEDSNETNIADSYSDLEKLPPAKVEEYLFLLQCLVRAFLAGESRAINPDHVSNELCKLRFYVNCICKRRSLKINLFLSTIEKSFSI